MQPPRLHLAYEKSRVRDEIVECFECANLYYRTILLSSFVEIRYCANALALFSFAINAYLNLPYNLSFYVRMCISMYMYVHVMFVYINVFIHIANAHYLLFRTIFQKD